MLTKLSTCKRLINKWLASIPDETLRKSSRVFSFCFHCFQPGSPRRSLAGTVWFIIRFTSAFQLSPNEESQCKVLMKSLNEKSLKLENSIKRAYLMAFKLKKSSEFQFDSSYLRVSSWDLSQIKRLDLLEESKIITEDSSVNFFIPKIPLSRRFQTIFRYEIQINWK